MPAPIPSTLTVQIKEPDAVAGLLALAAQRTMSSVSVGLAVNFERQTIEIDLDAGEPALHDHLKALISEHYRICAQSVSIDTAGIDAQGAQIPILNVVFTPMEITERPAVAAPAAPQPPKTGTVSKPAPIGQRAPAQAPEAPPVAAGLPEPSAPVSEREVLGPAPYLTGKVPPPANPKEVLPPRRSSPRPPAMDARVAVAEQLQEEAARGATGLNYSSPEDDSVPAWTRHPIRDLTNVRPPPAVVAAPRYMSPIPSQPQVVVDHGGSLF